MSRFVVDRNDDAAVALARVEPRAHAVQPGAARDALAEGAVHAADEHREVAGEGVEGAVVQAQGYAVLEDWKTKDGRVLTDQLSTYLIPTIWDIPEIVETVMVEVPDPNGPWGARGLGELPFLPVAAAIGAAIHDATGVWIDEFPFTPERVLRALGKI